MDCSQAKQVYKHSNHNKETSVGKVYQGSRFSETKRDKTRTEDRKEYCKNKSIARDRKEHCSANGGDV